MSYFKNGPTVYEGLPKEQMVFYDFRYSKASFRTTALDPVGGLNDSDWTITPN